jgi:endonuclease G
VPSGPRPTSFDVTTYALRQTERGGSPVFNDQFALVALHHAGGPRNELILESDQPVPEASNEGIRISVLVEALRARHDELPPALRAFLAEGQNPPIQAPFFESTRHGGRRGSLTVIPARREIVSGSVPAVAGSVVAEISLPIRLTLARATATGARRWALHRPSGPARSRRTSLRSATTRTAAATTLRF